MPATEETYRSQPTLHVVFAISSIAMTLVIVWMIMADHLRPWKNVQREFHRIEEAKLKVSEKEKVRLQAEKYQTQIDQLNAQITEAEQYQYKNASEIRKVDAELERVGGQKDRLDTAKRFQKAELDSVRSLYDGMIDRDEKREARIYRDTIIVECERKLLELSEGLEKAEAKENELKAKREDLLGHVDDLKKKRETLTRDADRVKRTIKQKEEQYFGLFAWLRSLPGIDLMPPDKIQQISLPDLTINYNFKDVPRYDRCTTCHQGIDRLGYDTDAEGKPMKKVFASHPHLTDGATALDPRGNVVKAGLYLDGNGPHKINSFGCTICHGGQGSGTDFTYASHTPNDLKQKEEWEHKNDWHEIHHWDEPMLPSRFMESSCLKCHHEVTDVPQAKKLQAGFERVTKYGCTGCHTIGGEGSFGPDLTDERQVGPNLSHLASKVSRDWTAKWIKNPHAFRPDSRMPRFYGVSNNDAPADAPKNDAEIQAITHYLFATSKPPTGFVDPPAKSDPAKGKELFLQKGCMACHSHRPYEKGEVQRVDRAQINPKYKPDATATLDPSGFPESVRNYAKADYGPNLSNISAKFKSHAEGYKWLANWIKSPEAYHPKSLMPNLQLSMEDSANIAAWILSVPGEWPVLVDVPAADSPTVKEGLDELVRLYVSKGGYKRNGKLESIPLSDVDEFVATRLSQEDKLMFLGEKTISRLGCFGCHNINGFETAKPIGTPLNGWGTKSPTKLDYGHIAEFLVDKSEDDDKARDGTDPYYQEQLEDHTRAGFLYQKLHRPRSYDYAKTNEDIKAWDERLRMPQFAWADKSDAVEEVMTFVLGLTGEKIASKYLPKSHYGPSQFAVAQGTKLLNRYNCTGCHVVDMPKFTVAAGKPLEEAFTDLATNVKVSYNARANDYLKEFAAGLTYDPKTPPELKPYDGQGVTIEGMPIGVFEDELTVQLWKPVTIRGFTFQVGDNLTLDKTKVEKTEAEGGNFAWLYASYQAEKTGSDFSTFWNRLPPPLLREGLKVQTPWLTSFLNDPYAIRPAVNLRMPKFHFGKSEALAAGETAGLANFFAARDGAEFPYQPIAEREQGYLAKLEAEHPDYLGAGWDLMAKGACIQCHALGQFKPTGGAEVVNGPDLRQVGTRFRPGYLAEWLGNPKRLVPYTAMPQNVPPHGPPPPFVPKTFADKPTAMVMAIRDTLLNYVNAVEQQLATNSKAGAPKTVQPAKPGASE
ncbi:c-type cytochrome [Singulisphaera acidiphila]|uniref:Cytochrome c n=1 Tax=Singulisphaera acidiphila (strain ATCC BAA-1392 / DSM 18658 / VKM B-2454 / MOB10) TaxID=886293 RepID=L0DAC1_SINAD|nr:cytochrome c [Singulisphaera acidiphila]AGA26197.1 Cytochrome c [Singulisphaera acidiphila DSM 18658]